MGTCNSGKKHHLTQQDSQGSLPDFTYVSRIRKLIIICHNGATECVELKGLLDIYPDSLLAYINSSYIVVLGGTSPSGEVSTKAYAINSIHLSIHNLPDLPEPISQGSILYHHDSLLVINSLTFKIFSFTSNASEWSELSLTFEHSKYKRLKHFGCYLVHSTVFIVSPSYKNQVQDSIYTFSLQEKCLRKTDQVSKFKLISPICLVSNDFIIIGGGKTEDFKENTKFYYKRKDEEWDEIQGPHVAQYENHPFIQVDNYSMFFNDLQVVIRYPRKFVIFNLKLPEHLASPELINNETNGFDVNLAKDKTSQSGSSEGSREDFSVESKNKSVKSIEISLDSSLEESKSVLSKDKVFVHKSRNSLAGIEIQVKEVKIKAPFLPSNVRKNYNLESESSFNDLSN